MMHGVMVYEEHNPWRIHDVLSRDVLSHEKLSHFLISQLHFITW